MLRTAQSGDGCQNPLPALTRKHLLGRRRVGVDDCLFFVDGDLPALAPQPHAALVGGDGPQPRPESFRLGQVFQLQVGGDQRLLRNVLGRVEILDEAQAQPEDGVAVTVDQDRVGAVVPLQARHHQLGVVHGNSFLRVHSPYECPGREIYNASLRDTPRLPDDLRVSKFGQ